MIISILPENGYPEDIIDFNMQKRVDLSGKRQGPRLVPVYLTLSWIGDKSMQFQRQLERSTRACFGPMSLPVLYSSTSLSKSSLKNTLSAPLPNNLVYEIECLCEKKYIGKTDERLKDRIEQHVPSAIRKGILSKIPDPKSNSQQWENIYVKISDALELITPRVFVFLQEQERRFTWQS